MRSTRLTGLVLLCGSLLAGSAHAASATRTSAFDYDAATGLLTKEIIEPDEPTLCVVTGYSYDAYGNKTGSTTRNCNGAAGSAPGMNSEAAAPSGAALFAARSSTTTYDAAGQFPASSSNALGHSETKRFDARFGTVASLTGPNGLTTQWQYDGFGRKVLEIRADGTRTRWEYLYCAGINGGSAACPALAAYLIQSTPLAADGVTPNGPWSKAYYDALDRQIRSETVGFDGVSVISQESEYDSLGRLARVSRPHSSGQAAQWTRYSYDALGRVLSETQPDGSTTGFSYNGLTTTVTNALAQTQSKTRNSQGQLVSVRDAQTNLLSYSYDPFGNLTRTSDALGNSTTLAYDLRGRKLQMNDPDMGAWSYVYNALGELVAQTDAKGQSTTLAYDLLGRTTRRSEADLISSWSYDRYADGSACPQGIGKLCEAQADNGYRRQHRYDALGRPSQTTTTLDSAYTSTTSYDADGRLATQTYPTGLAVRYVYTALGELREVRDGASGALYWRADTRDAEGRLLQQSFGNGVVTQHSYDPASGRLTQILAGAGNAVQSLAYQYDALGNLTARQDANQNLNETFLYDALNRLTSSTVNSAGAGILSKSYSYDALGNLVSRSDWGRYTYPASGTGSVRPHAVQAIALAAGGQRQYQYDANGNLTSETELDAAGNLIAGKGRIEVYTSFNMPQALGAPGLSLGFAYSPEHQRIKQSAPAATTFYLHPDNSGGLFYEKDLKPDGSVEHRHYLSAGGQLIALLKQTGSASVLLYLHRDALGSTSALTDAAGTLVERLAYEPFGKRRYPAGGDDPNNAITPTTTDRGFTNHEHLDELGLIHMNGRIYDPLAGRFMSADPYIQSPQNLQAYNRYAYVLNSPLNGTDPSGYFNLGKALGLDKPLRAITNTINAALDNPIRTAVIIAVAYYTGQWVGSTLAASASGTAGTSWAVSSTAGYCAATGESVVTGYTLTAAGSAATAAAASFAGSYLASGGDFQAGLKGAASGAVFGAVDGYYGNSWSYERLGANAVAGGISAKIYGTDVLGGAAGSFMTAAAKWGYYSQVGFGANPLPGENRPKTTYDVDLDTGRQFPDSIRMNVAGLNDPLTGNFWDDIGKQGGPLSKAANLIPGINATAALHDYWFNRPDHPEFTTFNNVGTMLPTAAMTYGALLNGPLTVQMSGRRR